MLIVIRAQMARETNNKNKNLHPRQGGRARHLNRIFNGPVFMTLSLCVLDQSVTIGLQYTISEVLNSQHIWGIGAAGQRAFMA